jgi:hypothetical protein
MCDCELNQSPELLSGCHTIIPNFPPAKVIFLRSYSFLLSRQLSWLLIKSLNIIQYQQKVFRLQSNFLAQVGAIVWSA